jgi:tRNA (cytidine56-2'-O)-methyltransferase
MEVAVLRLGHRLVRDARITTHVALVARAFGCQKIYMTYLDNSITKTINDVNTRWGGNDEFEIECVKDWKQLVQAWKKSGGVIIHLTMYGININNLLPSIDIRRKLLVIIGASKVPKEIYSISDYNMALGNQPHSEVSALAVFLDRLFSGKELTRTFKNAKIRIIPSPRGKRVMLN